MGESSSMSNKTRIPLFEGNNFNNWRFRVESALDEKDLLVYIQRDINELLTAAADNAKKEKSVRRNRRAKISLFKVCMIVNWKTSKTNLRRRR